jgi:stage II sporulation protein D
MIRRHSVAAMMALLALSCSSSTRYTSTPQGTAPDIRVLLSQAEKEVRVVASDGFRVQASSGTVVRRVAEAATVVVTRNGETLQIDITPPGAVAALEEELWLVPQGATTFEVGGTRYAGRIRVTAHGRWMLAVNVLPLETYLEGVVPHEIGNPGPDAYAAVQAQAITARTYALTRIEANAAEPFDVYAGVRDQVYRGREGGNRLATDAIRATSGTVLTYQDALARTYYSATCGGHTSDIRRVWPRRESAPYLYGRRDRDSKGTFCEWVHNFRWRYDFTGRQLGEILRATIPDELGTPQSRVGHLKDLRVVERSPSGRVRILEIVTTGGSFRVQGDRIRWVLKPLPDAGRILPSTLFDVELVREGDRVGSVGIIGGGNGHGVGMCQNGAIGMARRGYSHRMILDHYYPGTVLEKRY